MSFREMGFLQQVAILCAIAGGIALVWRLVVWMFRKVIESRARKAEKAEAEATARAEQSLAEKTYYLYRVVPCPKLGSRALVEQLAKRYKCESLVVGGHPLPATILWKNSHKLIPPDAVLGEFDASESKPLRNSPTILDPDDYRVAREFIKGKYEAPPSKVKYEGLDYRMVSINLSGTIPLVSGAFGLYYDNILTQYAIEWELKKALLGTSGDLMDNLSAPGSLPLREAVELGRNPLIDGGGRCAAITISTLVVFQRSSGELRTTIERRSTSVGVSPGLHHIVPAGMFEAPNRDDKWSIEENVWRELLEELYNEEEQIGMGHAQLMDHIRSKEPIRLLRELIQQGEAELSVTGICCDLLNLRPEICTVLYVPTPKLSEAGPMALNWEWEKQGPTGSFGVEWGRVGELATEVAATGNMVVSGAACLQLGRDWLSARHGI